MSVPDTMAVFARERLRELIDKAVFEMHNSARLRDPESVHKMRVAIRRFQQALRVFDQYVPKDSSRKVKREMRDVMKAAGELRNRDIALELLDGHDALKKILRQQRLEAKRHLAAILQDASRPDLSIKWRTRLELH